MPDDPRRPRSPVGTGNETERPEHPQAVPAVPHVPGSRTRDESLVPSEQPVMTDGQLGESNLNRGPEDTNPEGSVDISNTQYWREERWREGPTTRRWWQRGRKPLPQSPW